MLVEFLLFGGLLFLLWKSFRKPPELPPGKWGLPLVGYIPWTSKTFEDQIADFHKQYGHIFLWKMGTQLMVFINDYKLVKEAFSRHEFTNRPDWEIFKFFEEPAVGIGSSSGPLWHKNRRFTLRQLRDLGMGKSRLVEVVQQQTLKLRETLSINAGTPGRIPHQLFVTIINVIWQMVASRQFDAKDEKLKRFAKDMEDFVVLSNRLAFKDFLPWLQNILPEFLFRRLINYREMVQMKKRFFQYFHDEIENHRATLDPDNPRDLIDGYLLEMKDKKEDTESIYSDEDLAFLVFDLFFAGSETTVNTFIWMCCFLASHPHVQHKLHAEIDEVLCDGALPTLTEKSRMPYTEAVINEVLRISALVNFGVQHMANTDTQLGGYTIPKGTILSSSVTSIHHDNRYWNQSSEFRPERWLDENGKFSMIKEGFLPFGVDCGPGNGVKGTGVLRPGSHNQCAGITTPFPIGRTCSTNSPIIVWRLGERFRSDVLVEIATLIRWKKLTATGVKAAPPEFMVNTSMIASVDEARKPPNARFPSTSPGSSAPWCHGHGARLHPYHAHTLCHDRLQASAAGGAADPSGAQAPNCIHPF